MPIVLSDLQQLLWQSVSLEEAQRLSEAIQVSTEARTGIWPTAITLEINKGFREQITSLVERSQTATLYDLGSSTHTLGNFKNGLRATGITNYVGVDLGIMKNLEKTYATEQGDINVKLVRSEILKFLVTMPDNSANLWMTGLERGNVIRGNVEGWGLAVLREAKRVIPKHGFFLTDATVFDDVLPQVCDTPWIKERYNDSRRGEMKRSDWHRPFVMTAAEMDAYEIKADDPYLRSDRMRWVFDETRLGFRMYVDSWPIGGLGNYGYIINTEK